MRQVIGQIICIVALLAPTVSHAADDGIDLADMKAEYRRPDAIPFPEDNPYTDEKKQLGKMLFFDPRLSGKNNISCATCHNPSFGWEDGQPLGVGTPGKRLGRHTPTILNLAWGELFFWDGRAETLEDQALGPIQADVEMGQDMALLIDEIRSIEGYGPFFEAAFPNRKIGPDTIAKAIATYERTIVSGTAPFDRWIAGDTDAISESAKRGFLAFNTTAGCSTCHSGWTFTDHSFHDIGLADTDDKGRYEQVPVEPLKFAFKTPGLRNISQRAPYMHDGSMETLEEVVRHYADGFVDRPSLSADIKGFAPDDQLISDLVSFLKTLDGKDDPVTVPILPQ